MERKDGHRERPEGVLATVDIVLLRLPRFLNPNLAIAEPALSGYSLSEPGSVFGANSFHSSSNHINVLIFAS